MFRGRGEGKRAGIAALSGHMQEKKISGITVNEHPIGTFRIQYSLERIVSKQGRIFFIIRSKMKTLT
jgi:hypothetical protein